MDIAVQLVDSGGGTLQAGKSLRLSCAISGLAFDGGAMGSEHRLTAGAMGWFRQAPGKDREFVAAISPRTDETYYAESLEGRFSVSRDAAATMVFLQADNVRLDDTASYYCAADEDVTPRVMGVIPHADHWGQGTLVTVSSAAALEHHHHHH
uniref:llama Aa1 VHH domain n=1 Tax=Lama glama TaxID=9844 RepID=UPI0001C4E268|nr:Chain A, llama Aa1 VHH domain [Lama glama]